MSDIRARSAGHRRFGPGPATFSPSYNRAPTNLTSCIQIDVPDCHALGKRAVDAGAKAVMPLMDAVWGELKKAGDEFMASFARQPKK